MFKNSLIKRTLSTLCATVMLAAVAAVPMTAQAASGVSQGHGIKCVWVLTVGPNGEQVYTKYCYRGV